MSSAFESAAFISVYESVSIANYCGYASAALLAFEYVITLDQEVELFWKRKRKFTGASLLFFLNRYLALFCCFLNGFNVPMPDSSCAHYIKAIFALDFSQYIPWAVFSGLRALALNREKWPLAAIVFILSLAPAAVNYAQFGFGLTGVMDPTFGCVEDIALTPGLGKTVSPQSQQSISFKSRCPCALAFTVTLISRLCLIAADVLVIGITWVAVPGPHKLYNGSGLPVTNTLWRNGIVYFAVLLVLNLLHLVCTMVSFISSLTPFSYVTIFTEPMTAILVSRFLLDLQSACRKSKLDFGSSNTRFGETSVTASTIIFTKVIGSLGSTLDSVIEDSPVELVESGGAVEMEISSSKSAGDREV